MKGDREVNNKQHHSSSSGRLIYKLHSGGVARCLCVVPFSVFVHFSSRIECESIVVLRCWHILSDFTSIAHIAQRRVSLCVLCTNLIQPSYPSVGGRCVALELLFFLLLDRSCPALLPREHFLCGNLIQFYTIMKY